MTDPTTAAARALIDRSQYLTLATSDAAGRPWASPVWFAHDEYADFFWVSRPDARHSLNIEARPTVGLVVFDSSVLPSAAEAVYVEAEAEQMGAGALGHAIATFSEKSVRSGLPAWTAADVTGTARHRLYRARATVSFALGGNDRRVALPGDMHPS
jgi:nitroimidazol reductase NimA-like FMN-containing flavoprotein (pyridoxamine 5'-phosphate oxidase superfamily)